MAITNGIAGAAAAYAKTARNGASPGVESRDNKSGDSFADLVKGALEKAKDIGKTSEKRSMGAIGDEADLHQVVTAVAEAELTLQTVVNVRDKVVEAYREILRMPM
jgi:flagellar hook-basal body complex protein FliE